MIVQIKLFTLILILEKNQTITINEINNPEESLTLELSPKKVP